MSSAPNSPAGATQEREDRDAFEPEPEPEPELVPEP